MAIEAGACLPLLLTDPSFPRLGDRRCGRELGGVGEDGGNARSERAKEKERKVRDGGWIGGRLGRVEDVVRQQLRRPTMTGLACRARVRVRDKLTYWPLYTRDLCSRLLCVVCAVWLLLTHKPNTKRHIRRGRRARRARRSALAERCEIVRETWTIWFNEVR